MESGILGWSECRVATSCANKKTKIVLKGGHCWVETLLLHSPSKGRVNGLIGF